MEGVRAGGPKTARHLTMSGRLFPPSTKASVAKNLDVERAVKQDDEQAGPVSRNLVSHRFPRREVRIGRWSDGLAVGFESSLENDDRVRSRMSMHLASEAGRVPDQVMLLAGVGILVKEPQPKRPIVGCGR